jgi:hypothetical protein
LPGADLTAPTAGCLLAGWQFPNFDNAMRFLLIHRARKILILGNSGQAKYIFREGIIKLSKSTK